MIYDPAEKPFTETHKLMIGSIVPRPIAFVSTISKDGNNNVAPFSYFNGVCSNPPTVMFAPARRGWDGEEKDTLINIRDNHEFVITIEEGSIGGFGSHVAHFLSEKNLLDNNLKFRSMILPDRFIDHGKPELMYKYAGLDASNIETKIMDTLNSKVIIKKTN